MMQRVLWFTFVFFLTAGAGPICQPQSYLVYAQEDWKAEFADICSKTEDPMALSKEEVKTLIERCEKLKPRIEKLDESTSKVYLKRLQMCRDLFVFVVESKNQVK
jgi:hypothetical protein